MTFEFDRYINGQLMAEGVTIERQGNLPDAMREAARIASRGPNGEVPVLVLRAEALSRTGAVKVKPLDLSNLLRHAFFEGFMIAGGSQEAAAEWWPEYDPETCPAYSRILSTLEPAPEAQQESVVVSVADINTWRAEWMDANDPQDGTDCVTPFDKYLYTRPTHGRRR